MLVVLSYSCEGGCLRSFHATEEAGAGSHCKSLGFMQDDVVVCSGYILTLYFLFISFCYYRNPNPITTNI